VASDISELARDSVLIFPVFEGDDAQSLADLPISTETAQAAFARGEVRARRFETALFHGQERPSLLLIGAGERGELEPILAKRLAAAGARFLVRRGFTRIAFRTRGLLDAVTWARAVTQGAIEGPYDPGVKKTHDRARTRLEEVQLVSGDDREKVESGARIGCIVAEATTIARDLVNLPANELTPTAFAERARELAGTGGLVCKILGEDVMRQLGMGSFLGVSAGSDEPAQLIVLRYGPDDASVRLALVGKGLTFDSGGLSLKTAEGMETMKGDMGGGAAVVAGMLAVARLAPEGISVTGYVGATENMPSGKSMRPGDVLTAMNGKTIEVLNTDAEGRLVLADVLAYACSQGATHVVDFATLTGGAIVALGHAATLTAGKPQSWVRQVADASVEGLERAWPMPQYEEYRRAMDSKVADIKNTGGRYGSALTATAFLSEFVDGVPWAHMDVAGTAWVDEASPYQAAGGTGAGVGTIASLTASMSRTASG
jgi:leucyl aminopeptidase